MRWKKTATAWTNMNQGALTTTATLSEKQVIPNPLSYLRELFDDAPKLHRSTANFGIRATTTKINLQNCPNPKTISFWNSQKNPCPFQKKKKTIVDRVYLICYSIANLAFLLLPNISPAVGTRCLEGISQRKLALPFKDQYFFYKYCKITASKQKNHVYVYTWIHFPVLQ